MADEGMMQHLCECFIDNNCEHLNVIWRGGPDDLVSWPEIRVLMEVHGEQGVYDIRPVKLGPRDTPLREKERLSLKYGRDKVEAVYAGKSFNMEFFVPGWPIDPTEQASTKHSRQTQNAKVKRRMGPEPDAAALDAPV